MARARIDFITVTYGLNGDTRALVESLARLDGIAAAGATVTIVDNASTAQTEHELRALAPIYPGPLVVLPQRENLWYWRGVERAWRERYPDPGAAPDWLVICNNDVVFDDPAFLTRLGEVTDPGIGVVAPRIVSAATGADQNPFLERPRSFLQRLQWHVFYSHYVVARLLVAVARGLAAVGWRHRGRRAPADPRDETPRRVYAPHGACLVLAREYFVRGGRLDTTVKMYAEELTTAATAAALGLGVLYCPGVRARHQEHGVVGGSLTRVKYDLQRAAFYNDLRDYPPRVKARMWSAMAP